MNSLLSLAGLEVVQGRRFTEKRIARLTGGYRAGSEEPADKWSQSYSLSTQYGPVAVMKWGIVYRSDKTSESQLPPESYLQFPDQSELRLRRLV